MNIGLALGLVNATAYVGFFLLSIILITSVIVYGIKQIINNIYLKYFLREYMRLTI